MVTEIVELVIKPGSESQFETDMDSAKVIISGAKGCKGVELMRSIEVPANYRLVVTWESMENNTVDFRQSPGYKDMGRLLRDHLDGRPAVQHFNILAL